MNKLFKPKAMRRLLLFMALIFPIVYLCGGLFSALWGSHGEFDWHENTLVQPKTYQEAMQVDNFSYGDWNWDTGTDLGIRYGFSLGHLLASDAYGYDLSFYVNEFGVNVTVPDSITYTVDNYGLGFNGSANALFGVGVDHSEFYFDDSGSLTSSWVFPFYLCDSAGQAVTAVVCSFNSPADEYLIEMFGCEVGDFSWTLVHDLDWYGWGESVYYFDDGAHLPEGVSWPDYLASYFVPTLKAVESDSLSDYIFSQPFASNNFISELGEGVINNENAGFAPMNELFYTINENVLHFDQNDKLAVFGYGYVYYAVNVLIIYEILILAVKLIMLPLKAVDVFDNEER